MTDSSRTFDRETLLDLTVNGIPLAIMLFFVAVFALLNPFNANPVHTALQFSIVLVTFGALALLTYVSGKAISNAETELEEKGYPLSEAAGVEPGTGASAAPALEDGEASGETTAEGTTDTDETGEEREPDDAPDVAVANDAS